MSPEKVRLFTEAEIDGINVAGMDRVQIRQVDRLIAGNRWAAQAQAAMRRWVDPTNMAVAIEVESEIDALLAALDAPEVQK